MHPSRGVLGLPGSMTGRWTLGFAAIFLAWHIALWDVTAQRPAFTSQVEFVAVNVVVMDDQSRNVIGLPQDAFQISEDDRPQTIAQFTKDAVPLSVVIALDTSSSMRGDRFINARKAVWRVVDQLASVDEISIYGFNDWPYVISPWTSSRNMAVMAMSAVAPVSAGGFTSLNGAIQSGLAALDAAAGRRRAVIVISDGNDELPGDHLYRDDQHVVPRNLSAASRLAHAVDYINRSEGLLYAIGIAGSDPRRQIPLDEHALRSLTDPTGGFSAVVHGDSDIPTAVQRVIDDLRHQYLLGFAPMHPPDGKFHRLKVRVRGCVCRARARAGYFH